jgi:threonyl-tRNA synthetase
MGLMRVRAMQMNDAHIYCTEEQFESEFRAVNDMYLKYFQIFGLEKYQMRFLHPRSGQARPEVRGHPVLWKKTEDMVRDVLIRSGINYVEVPNEAAFYGPKIDVQVWSAIGKEFTIATNQVDFAVPPRFGLQYRTSENTFETPLCIHRAPLGTHERFIGFLIEHYAGNFPLWLAPEQVRVNHHRAPRTRSSTTRKRIVTELRSHGVRADGDYGPTRCRAKSRKPSSAKSTPCSSSANAIWKLAPSASASTAKATSAPSRVIEVVADLLAAIQERRP